MTGRDDDDETFVGNPREDTFAALRSLASLADRAYVQNWTKLAAALRATVEVVEGRLRNPELTIVVAGGRAKRTLLNLLAGNELFPPKATEPAGSFVVLRRAPRIGYVAHLTEGRVEQFKAKEPDRAAWFEREIEKAEKELAAAALQIVRLDAELGAKEETLSERRIVVAERERASAGAFVRAQAMLVTLLAWFLSAIRVRPHPQLPAPSRSAPADGRVVSAMIARRDVEREIESAEGRALRLRTNLDRIRAEAARHEAERRVAFVSAVAALSDAAQRGGEVIALTVDVDGGMLPEGIVILDAPAAIAPVESDVRSAYLQELRDRAGACLLLAAPGSVAIGDLENAVRPIIPRVVDASDAMKDEAAFVARLRESLPAIFERARVEGQLSVLALALADMPSRMHALAAAVAAGEAEVEERIEALERDRLPEPAKFREDQLGRMTTSFDEGSRRVLKRAQAGLRERAAQLESEWVSAIEACRGAGDLRKRAMEIESDAKERVRKLLDAVGDDIGAEMQSTSELLQVWVLDEIRRRYKTRELHADKPPPVIAQLPTAEVAALEGPLLSPVFRAFDRRRMGLAFGSLATGAAIGGAIYPLTGSVTEAAVGSGAAVLVGLTAMLIPRKQPLKERCIVTIRAHVAVVEKNISASLEASTSSFARDIRTAVDDTMRDALKRRDRSIAWLMDLEGKQLAREQRKLSDMTELKTELDKHGTLFAELAKIAEMALHAFPR